LGGIYVVLYAPSSVQKLLDFVKTAYAVSSVIPVIVRPLGAAAQVGLPEAHKLSYKLGRPLIVLPEIRDLREVLNCDTVLYFNEEGVDASLHELLRDAIARRAAIIVSSGEHEPSRKELEGAQILWPREVPRGIAPTALIGIIVYELHLIERIK
jgi:SpoU rRNA methylase family enzyme